LNEWKLTGEGKGDKNGINSQTERDRQTDREREEKWGNTKDKKRR